MEDSTIILINGITNILFKIENINSMESLTKYFEKCCDKEGVDRLASSIEQNDVMEKAYYYKKEKIV